MSSIYTRPSSRSVSPFNGDMAFGWLPCCSAPEGVIPSVLIVPMFPVSVTLTQCVCLDNRQIYKKSFLPLEEYYNFPDFFSPTMSDNDIGATSRQPGP
jgi:hypothetical protein